MDSNNAVFAVPAVPAHWQNTQPPISGQRGHYGGSRGFHNRPYRGNNHNNSTAWQQADHHHGQSQSRGRGQFRGRGGRGQDGSRGRGHSGRPNKRQRPFKERPISDERTKFYCCACDRAFKTQEEKEDHDSEHIICGLDGCQFEAHALVVTKHVKMQHTDGLYDRIKSLKTPEDINLWKEERKKNFPTLANVQKKDDERKEKEDRREICGLRGRNNSARPSYEEHVFRYKIPPAEQINQMHYEYESRMRRIEFEQGDAWRHRSFAPDLKFRNVRVPFASMNQSPIVTLESYYLDVKEGKDGKLEKRTKVKWKGFKVKTLERLPDSESEAEDEDLPISDEEETMDQEKPIAVPLNDDKKTKNVKLQPQPSLGLSLVNYSSASESDNEDDISAGGDKSVPDSHKSNTLSHVAVSNDAEDKGSSSTISISDSNEDEDSDTDDEMEIEEFSGKSMPKLVPLAKRRILRKKSWNRNHWRTKLLERLLHDRIRKERNIILQTCRFFCENDFFMGKETKSADKPSGSLCNSKTELVSTSPTSCEVESSSTDDAIVNLSDSTPNHNKTETE